MAAVCSVQVVLGVMVWALLAPSVNAATTTTSANVMTSRTPSNTTTTPRRPQKITTAAQGPAGPPGRGCVCPITTTETPLTTTSPCPGQCQQQIDDCKQETERTAARFDNFTEKVEKDRAALKKLLDDTIANLTSRVDAAESRLKMIESENDDLKKQLNKSQTHQADAFADMSSRIGTLESLAMTFQSNVTSLTAAGFITRCKVCFQEIEGSSQCQRNRLDNCSGWSTSTSPSWTLPFRDDTDGRSGGCTYQWRVICE